MATMTSNDRRLVMRAFLATLTDPGDDWEWIGRTAYRRGARGVFRLDVANGGSSDRIAGLRGTYIPHVGGEPDRIDFWFADILLSEAREYNGSPHPNYRGESCNGSERDWSWGIAVPQHIEPLHDAIRDWTMVHEITAKELEDMARDDRKASRRAASKHQF